MKVNWRKLSIGQKVKTVVNGYSCNSAFDGTIGIIKRIEPEEVFLDITKLPPESADFIPVHPTRFTANSQGW